MVMHMVTVIVLCMMSSDIDDKEDDDEEFCGKGHGCFRVLAVYKENPKRKEGINEDAREKCWEGVLIDTETEIWRSAELSEDEKEDIATCQRWAMDVVRRMSKDLDAVVENRWANPGDKAKLVASESRRRLRAALKEWKEDKQEGTQRVRKEETSQYAWRLITNVAK